MKNTIKTFSVLAVIVVGLLLSSSANAQIQGKSRSRKLPPRGAVTVLDNEAKLTLRNSRKRRRDTVFIGGGASTGARHNRHRINSPNRPK